MDNATQIFLNPYVLTYLVSIAGVQLLYGQIKRKQQETVATRRRTRGLPTNILLNQPKQLIAERQSALLEAVLLLATLVGMPFLLSVAVPLLENQSNSTASRLGLMLAFAALITTLLWSAKGPLRGLVGGLAFRVLAVSATPFEIGDRITIKGISGKVIGLSTFLLELETAGGKRVSLPTHLLWNEMVVSEGDRAAQCETVLYLPVEASTSQSRTAEAFLLELVQSSVYLEPSKPVQIYFESGTQALKLTAVAYAVSAGHTRSLTSEVTKGFLAFTEREQLR